MMAENHDNDLFFIFLTFKWTCTQQMEEEWNQVNSHLQAAREQIGDLNLQVTILTSGKN